MISGEFLQWFDKEWDSYQDKAFTDKIQAKAWALKAWRAQDRDALIDAESHWMKRAQLAGKEVERLEAVIHEPENDNFIKGVSIESEYQRKLHGVDATEGRFDWHQWYWVVGYLAGKALAACKSGEGNGEKAKHHLITTAALLMNWHNVLTGKPAASVHSNSGKAIADQIAAASTYVDDMCDHNYVNGECLKCSAVHGGE